MALNPAANGRPRWGLFGGSFDPVHLAHRALALSAMHDLQLERVLWIPAGQAWQKTDRSLLPGEHRVAMLQLMLADEPRFSVDERELHRSGASYSIDTVQALTHEHPGVDWTLIIGQDQLAGLPTWHRWRELLGMVSLGVAGRAGQAVQAGTEVLAESPRLMPLAMPAMDISSTRARDLASRGEDIAPMVGEKVAGYIAQHRLYREY